MFLFTFVVMYNLSINPVSPTTATQVLRALYSVVLAVIALRAIQTGLTGWTSSTAIRAITERLVSEPLPDGERLSELVRDYDFQRVGGPSIPTCLYRMRRTKLAAEWAICRKELGPE